MTISVFIIVLFVFVLLLFVSFGTAAGYLQDVTNPESKSIWDVLKRSRRREK